MSPPPTGTGASPGGRSRARPFASAFCLGPDWRTVAETLADRLEGGEGRLGILYAAESFAPHLDAIAAPQLGRLSMSDYAAPILWTPRTRGAP